MIPLIKWQVPSHERVDFKPKNSKYAVLIPVINEGLRIQEQLRKMTDISIKIDVYIVDGGSTDKSLCHNILKEFSIRSLLTKRGPGKLSSQLRLGLATILKDGYEGVILVDGNNKDDTTSIIDFAKALEVGQDYIQGSRFIKGGKAVNTPLIRYLAIRLIHAPIISIASRKWQTDTTNGFKAYSKSFLTNVNVQPFRNIFSKYELHYYLAVCAGRLKLKMCEIPVTRSYPAGTKTPTKIKGYKGYLEILSTLFMVCFTNKYNPRSSS